MKLLFLTLSIVVSSITLANGGPVAWTGGTGEGGISPKQRNDIGLDSETLEIVVDNDFNHYQVKATYLLVNPNGEKKVSYGVPVVWVNEEGLEGSGAKSSTAEGEKAAKEIHLDVGGKNYSCSFVAETKKSETLLGWCVAELKIPKGAQVPLVLSYRGEMSYVDAEFTKSALTRFAPRKLTYPFFPAGFWKGKANRVSISVDPGPFPKGPAPKGFKSDNGKWTKTLVAVDLKRAKSLELTFDSAPLARRQLLLWNQNAKDFQKLPYEISATSALGPYEAKNASDGKPETAWCLNTPKGGVGESITLKAPESAKLQEYCKLQGLMLAPGYLKNDDTYRANGRVKKIKVSQCANPAVAEVFSLKIPSRAEEAPQFVEFDNEKGINKEPYCLKIEILEIEKGAKSKDTCVSEIAAIINCS